MQASRGQRGNAADATWTLRHLPVVTCAATGWQRISTSASLLRLVAVAVAVAVAVLVLVLELVPMLVLVLELMLVLEGPGFLTPNPSQRLSEVLVAGSRTHTRPIRPVQPSLACTCT